MRATWTAVALALSLTGCKFVPPVTPPLPPNAGAGGPVGAPAADSAVSVAPLEGDSDVGRPAFGAPADVEQAREGLRLAAALANVYPALMQGAPCPGNGAYPPVLAAMAAAAYAPGARIFEGVRGMEYLRGHSGGEAMLAYLDAVRCTAGDAEHPGLTLSEACALYVPPRGDAVGGGLEWVSADVVREGKRPPMLAIRRMATNGLGKIVLATYAATSAAQGSCAALSEAQRRTYRCQAEPGGKGCGG